MRAIFGLDERPAAGLDELTARIHPEDRPAWDAAIAAARRDGVDFDLRYRVLLPAPNGGEPEVRWVLDKGRTTRDAEGTPLYQTGAIVDFTGEQRARAAAEAGNRAKDEFLAMLGHELRNPLSPILTSLQLMKLRAGDALVKERQVIERQVQHMVRLVDDLLDVSRITRGKVDLRRRRVELSEVVAKAIEMASPLFEQRAHRLTTEMPGVGLPVLADEQRLAQVVSNLLTNAAKYTDPGGRIDVSARREDGKVELTVADSGIGIAPELLSRVFDLFVQGERTLERSQGGLGLGLTLVRRLVELHGGTVSATSAGPGRGSRFTVRLPLDAGAIEPAARSSDFVAAAAPDRAARRVIVVDDNRDAAETLAEALRHAGHEVRVAFDGPSALELDERERPDVAFVDLGLPVMDGYEVARRMRDRAIDGRPRLVAVTGYGQESDRKRSAAVGFDHHLVKPVDLVEALKLVSA